jgi:CheY-like chemotaxis protein
MEKKKIIIVDDEKDFLNFIKWNLESTGKYDIIALSNAKDLITHVHSFKPNLILLDMVMPEIGGIESCEMLHNDPVGKTIPIIIISALGKEKDKAKAYMSGVKDYLVKPVDKKDLLLKVEKILGQ